MKAIIFDVDNTLIELRKEYVNSVRDLLKEMDYDLIVITPLAPLHAIENDFRQNGVKKFCFALEMLDEQRRIELYENSLFI